MRAVLAQLLVAFAAAMVPVGLASVGGRSAADGAAGAPAVTLAAGEGRDGDAAPGAASRSPDDVAGAPWAAAFLRAAVERARSEPGDYQLELELRRLIYALGSVEECRAMAGIFAALEVGDGDPMEAAYRDVFARWAELDPVSACAAADLAEAAVALEGAFHTWASSDLASAAGWAIRNPALNADADELLAGAIAHIIHYRGNGAEMFAEARALEAAGYGGGLASDVLRAWGRNAAPADVVTAIESLPERAMRERFLAEAVAAIGIESPGSAFYYLDKITDPDRRAEVAHRVFWPYALTRTPDIYRSPPDPVQALENHVGHWPIIVFSDAGNALTRHKASAALDKARKIPPGAERDAFVRGMVDGAVFTDDPESVRSAIELAGEPQRGELLARFEAQLEPSRTP